MKNKLSVVMITKNAEELLDRVLNSVKNISDEIIIIDDLSKDKTIEIAKKYQAKVYQHHEYNLGKQRQFALSKAKNDWILVLDSDEIVTKKLSKEIGEIISLKSPQDGYYITCQVFYLGQLLKYGGAKLEKLILFQKKKVKIKKALIHEKFTGKNIGSLKNIIIHYSYRNFWQMYKKFTDYSFRYAKELRKQGEKTSLKKIFLYPIHMFYVRFVADHGYKDGFFRLSIDIGYAYMEFLTYFLMIFL